MDIDKRILAIALVALIQGGTVAAQSEPEEPSDKSGAEFQTTVVGRRAAPDPVAPFVIVEEEALHESSRPGLPERLSQEVPGLYVNARGPGGYGIAAGAAGSFRMRGLGGSLNTEVLVLEDGTPDQMGIFGHPIPDAYLPAFVQEVQVLPGGDSVLYGSGAMAAAILIETAWPRAEGAQVRLWGEGGSFHTVQAVPGILGRYGAWDYLAGATLFHSDGHRAGAGAGLVSSLLKVRYRLSDHHSLEVRQRSTILDGADPGPASRPNPDHWFRVRRFNQAATYRYARGAAQVSTSAFANVGLHRLYDGFRSRDLLAGFLARVDVAPADGLMVTGGADVRVIGGRAENLLDGSDFGSHHVPSAAAYAQVVWDPWPWLTLVTGGRVQWNERYGVLPLFKGGMSVRPWPGGSLYARAVQNFRDPTVMEMDLPFPKANADLRPERALNTDFGVSQNWPGVLVVSVGGYRLDARDFIRLLGAYPSFRRENVDRITHWGIEGSLRVTAWKPVSLRLAATRVWRGHVTAQNPDTKVNGTVDVVVGPWRVALSGEWVSGLYAKDYWQDRLDDVAFLDLRCDYEWAGGRGRAYVIFRNITNHRYSYIQDYPMPGVHGMGGLELAL